MSKLFKNKISESGIKIPDQEFKRSALIRCNILDHAWHKCNGMVVRTGPKYVLCYGMDVPTLKLVLRPILLLFQYEILEKLVTFTRIIGIQDCLHVTPIYLINFVERVNPP